MILILLPTAATYYITNARYGQSLIGGGDVGLHIPENRDSAKWVLEPDTLFPENFYLRNLQTGKYLYSGFKYDRHVYEGDVQPEHQMNYRWKIKVVSKGTSKGTHSNTVSLIDKAHSKALGAGSNHNDGNVYLYDPCNDSYARWSFVLVDYPAI